MDKRLRWRCRRGTRELDLIFERFLHTDGGRLDAARTEIFERLLDHPDQQILDWVMERTAAPDVELAPLLARLRALAAPLRS